MPGYMGTDDDDSYEGHATLADYVGVYDGDDTVNTYGGHDNVVAGDGDNRIDVGTGNDTITSGDGNDWLVGGDGNDNIIDDGARFYLDQKIFGGSGNDEIMIRGGGKTYLYGGSGDDTFRLFRWGDINEITWGVPNVSIAENSGTSGGHDRIILSTGWSGFVMAENVEDLIADNANAQSDRITWDNHIDDTVLGVEVTGNACHNNMLGSIVRDVLSGGTGNDTLDAYFGEGDKLFGGDGHDRLILNFARAAHMYGGAGDDTYVLRSWTTDTANSIVEWSNSGADTLEMRGTSVDLNRSNLYAIENLTFSSDFAGAARTVTGNGLSNALLTHLGNDTVFGLGGADEIRTAGGIDWLEGGAGSDTLDGGTEDDRLHGGTDNDSLLAGSGNDWAFGEDGNDTIDAGAGVDFVYGGAGNDWIAGRTEDDFIYGDTGNDSVMGDGGNDRLRGGDGSDTVYGGAGNDQIRGDAGVDLLYGNDGADPFIFGLTTDSPYSGFDRVMDFVRGADKIDLSGIDANATLTGNQAFGFSADRPFFTGAGDVWTTNSLVGDLIEGDINGDGISDFRILVTGVWNLQASDFML